MAVALPNGVTFAIASAYASALTVTAASNASACVLTVTNTLAIGDYVEFASGWSNANSRVFRLSAAAAGSVTLEGFDTSSTTLFPAGSGTGTIKKINTWQQVQQVLTSTSSGGEAQYKTYSFLEQSFESQIPTTTSPRSIALEIADDPTLAGYQALKTISLTRAVTAVRGALPQGGFILFTAIASLDEFPSMTKGELMSVKASLAAQGLPTRYAS